MKNVLFTTVAVVMFGFVANAQADTYKFSTAELEYWQVATLMQQGVDKDYVNPVRTGSNNNYTYDSKTKGTTWNSVKSRWDQDWSNVAWTDAAPGKRGNWYNSGEDWIAAVDTGVAAGVGSSANSVANGFYAFQYTFATEVNQLVESITGILNINYTADDYLAAIYANGVQIFGQDLYAKGFSGKVDDESNPSAGWKTMNGLTLTDIAMNDGLLNLVFVIHNTDAATTSAAKNNAMGLYLDATLTTDVKLISVPNHPGDTEITSNTTPEPATLLILGLGAVGAGFTARRRMTK